MKSFLFLILLLLIASPSFAQLFGRDYNAGSYYTADGQRHDGLLAMDFDPPSIFSSHPDNTLYFKTDTGAKRQKVKASTIKGFVVTNKDTARTDSFVIVHPLYHSHIKYDYDFIQVIDDDGPVKLYNYRLQRKVGGGYGSMFGALSLVAGAAVTYYDNYYFFGKNADIAVEMKRKDFIEVMSKMLADDPNIVAMIKNKTYTIGDMHKMLKAYYAHRFAPTGQLPAHQ